MNLDWIGKLFGGGQNPQQRNIVSPLPSVTYGSGAVSRTPSGGNIYPSNFIGPIRPTDQQFTNYSGSALGGSAGVLGANTSTGNNIPSGGGVGGGGAPLNSSINQLGQQQQALINARKQNQQHTLDSLGNQKNSLLDQIGSNYGNAISSARSTLANNLSALNQAKTDTTTGYENQKTDQGRLLLDQERQNRIMARALGDNSSSYYENLQSGAQATANQNITSLDQTEQSQLDQIGQQIIQQNTDGQTKIDQLNQAELQAQNDVISKYQDAFNQASDQSQLDNLTSNMQSTLDSISQTFQNYKAGAVANPIADFTKQAQALSTIQSVTQPLQDQSVLQNAISQLQQDPSQFNNIVGQLQFYDAQNGTQLAQQITNNFKLGNQQSGGFLGIGAQNTPTLQSALTNSPVTGQGPLQIPQQSSYLDQIKKNLGIQF